MSHLNAKNGARTHDPALPPVAAIGASVASEHAAAPRNTSASGFSSDLRSKVKRILARFMPAYVVIDGDLRVQEFHGNAGRYFELAPGGADLSLVTMLREGLLKPVRRSLHAANLCGETVRAQDIEVRTNCGTEKIDIEVTPLHVGSKNWVVLIFEPASTRTTADSGHCAQTHQPKISSRARAQVVRMRQEVACLRESLRVAIRQQETTNGELSCANDEVQSANEELQSINEELETSREQLQSSNDELMHVNEQLLNRTLELSAINSELSGMLSSVHISIVLVDSEARIKRFTTAAQRLFNLIPADVGRPLQDLNLSLLFRPSLHTQLREVIDSGANKVFDVEDKTGNRYSIRLWPYLNESNRIDGAAIVALELS